MHCRLNFMVQRSPEKTITTSPNMTTTTKTVMRLACTATPVCLSPVKTTLKKTTAKNTTPTIMHLTPNKLATTPVHSVPTVIDKTETPEEDKL